jgi:hypothetical protein
MSIYCLLAGRQRIYSARTVPQQAECTCQARPSQVLVRCTLAGLTANLLLNALTWHDLTWLVPDCKPAFECPDVARLDLACSAARWCGSWTGPTDPTRKVGGSQWLPDSMLGAGSPPDAAIAVGWLGRTMIIVPSQNLVVVTLGSSWGSGIHCDGGQVRPWLLPTMSILRAYCLLAGR